MTSQDLVDTLQPELDQLVAAFDVEPDERQAVANGALALFAACRRMLDEHDLDWPPDATLAVVECACISTGKVDHAAAIRTIRQYHAWVRAERANLN